MNGYVLFPAQVIASWCRGLSTVISFLKPFHGTSQFQKRRVSPVEDTVITGISEEFQLDGICNTHFLWGDS